MRSAGETAAQYIERLESAERERDFLRDQLTDLQLHVALKSAPRRKSQLARLLAGLLRREDWRNGTWR